MKKVIINKILKLPWIRDEIERKEIELVDKTIDYYKEYLKRNNAWNENQNVRKELKEKEGKI